LDRAGAKAVLRKFDAVHPLLRHGVKLRNLPADLKREIDRISLMRTFEKELSRFLDDYGLPPLTKNRPDGQAHFLYLYARVIEDIPLMVSLPGAGKQKSASKGIPPVAPRHISRIVVHVGEAREDVGGETLFRVTWTIHDKSGQSGDISVYNSFTR
jgi:hypothetical protein